jgi:hypothetical protein
MLQVLHRVKTIVGDKVLFRERTSRGCLIFQSEAGSERIMKSNVLLTDGTFPKISIEFKGLTMDKDKFYQVVTLQSVMSSGGRDSQTLVLDSIAILPDKKYDTY